ncbi:4Fe-4S dicluster domain-containing protein [Desulfovibrio desulfuricans]|uniref:4Fe-4S dicluster domain-containing protein n=1 Tax=Desulfovibrio desulfuricans TaxID=876 RepID=UPI0003FCF8BB|nr:4Fe-4S dicluster domain-containing protein [Desulfovibrio desulfuricans]MDD3682425.1 4Fe-4S dicluster domain-containing protein [Desulfovibrio desulfuricans]
MTEHIQVVPDKCRACRRCEVACIAAHHGMSFKEAMKHRDELVSRVQVVKAEGFKTTVRCHQCDHAPCANVCPTGALQQDADGRIIMRVQYCVACKMCIAACPYGTITLDTIGMPSVDGDDGETLAQRARREVAVRCDMCRAWRMENGKRITACMEACPAHALSLVLADGSVVEAPAPEKKPAIEGAPEKPAAPVAEPGPRASVTAAGRTPEEAKAEAPAAPVAEAAAPAPVVESPVAPKAEEPKVEAPVEAPAEANTAPVVEEAPAPAPEVKTEPAAEAPATELAAATPVETKPEAAPAAPKAAASKPAKSNKKATRKGGKK